MRNYIANSRYRYGIKSPCVIDDGCATVGDKNFFFGSGNGGRVVVTREAFRVGQCDVPGNPEYFLRAKWLQAPAKGEDQYAPGFRWTWLEYHIHQARELIGNVVHYSTSLRVESGSVYVVPIIWINYANGDYRIFSLQGVAVTDRWTTIAGQFLVPPYPLDKALDTGHYVGFGFDFVYQTAPVIDVAPIQFYAPGVVVDEAPAWLEYQLSQQP